MYKFHTHKSVNGISAIPEFLSGMVFLFFQQEVVSRLFCSCCGDMGKVWLLKFLLCTVILVSYLFIDKSLFSFAESKAFTCCHSSCFVLWHCAIYKLLWLHLVLLNEMPKIIPDLANEYLSAHLSTQFLNGNFFLVIEWTPGNETLVL